MGGIKIKLCGMMRIEDIDYANEAKPDYAGFVFADTRRKISYDTAVEFKKRLDDGIKAVGVFVDDNVNNVAYLLNNGIIDMAQLHGAEDRGYIEELRELCGRKIEVIKAARINGVSDIIDAHMSGADYLLFDAYRKGIPGGTGEKFNWDIIRPALEDISEGDRIPYFIAGGIHAGNVKDALKLGSYGIDISTGIETDGIKDRNKMIEIVRRIRDV